jgi:hypothetical protein
LGLSKKQLIRIILPILLVGLLVLQIQKRNEQRAEKQKRELALKATNNELSKVLFQLPIYRDTVYSVFLAHIRCSNKIIFLRKGNLSDKQKESRFFVHIYPKDKSILEKGASHIPNNFKNNVTSFFYEGEQYFVSDTSLPQIKISKLNLGQFGFRSDNSVSWKTNELLNDRDMGRILKENKEETELFDLNKDSF